MLLRGLGAMNGLRGGGAPPSTGFGTAVAPSNCGTEERWRSGIETAGDPGTCAEATPAVADQAVSVSAAITTPTPQPRWRMGRRAYGRLRADGAEAARADPGAEPPDQPFHARLPGRRERRADLLQRGRRWTARHLVRGAGPHVGPGVEPRRWAVRRGRRADPDRGASDHAGAPSGPSGPRLLLCAIGHRRGVRNRVHRLADRRGGGSGGRDDLLLGPELARRRLAADRVRNERGA